MLNPVQPPQPSAAKAKEAWGSFLGDDGFVHPGDSPREPRVLPWADMLNPVGVLFFWGGTIILSQGFTLGLNVIPLRGIFWTPSLLRLSSRRLRRLKGGPRLNPGF